MKKIPLLLFLSFILCSCASYIASTHKKFDEYDQKQKEEKQNSQKNKEEHFFLYGDRKRPYKSNLNITKLISNHRYSRYASKNHKKVKTRHKVSDLSDNNNNNSLWFNNKDSRNVNYLFTRDEVKQIGDIVLIHVYKKFKNEISQELRRVFAKQKNKKQNAKTPKTSMKGEGTKSSSVSPEREKRQNNKVKDQISGIIIGEVSTNHLLIKGQKRLLYRNMKTTVEVQALIARRNINDNDVIKSDDFLDFSIEVIKRGS